MESMRIADQTGVPQPARCCRCPASGRRWDRIAGAPYCPNCQEALVQGEGAPLVLRTQPQRCAVCDRAGTVAYLTFPLGAEAPVEMDLCPAHLRALLGRCLEPRAFQHLGQRLQALGHQADKVFLLHGGFYDAEGRASLPALEMD